MSGNGEYYKLVIVDGLEYGETIREMFMQAASGSWLECVNLSLEKAWIDLGINHEKANGVLVHGSLQGNALRSGNIPNDGVALARELKQLGYQVNVLTAGGSRKFELSGFEKEAGVGGFTHTDIKVILALLEVAAK